jgi:hypothetical protein
MEIYLAREEIKSRFLAASEELLNALELPLPMSLVARQMLPALAEGAPEKSAVAEVIMERLAGVYGYRPIFVKEVCSQTREQRPLLD